MRKFETWSRPSLPFRLLVILAGAFLLLAAFAPCANADCPGCLRFYDFEHGPQGGYPVGLNSDPPALEQGALTTLTLFSTTIGVPYPVAFTSAETPGLAANLPSGADPNLTALGIHRAGVTNLNILIPFFSATGIYDITSVSFAINSNGNGFAFVSLRMSTDGGLTFPTTISAPQVIPGGTSTLTLNVTPGTTLNIPMLVLSMTFTNGQSNGVDLQDIIDNIQVNGTAVPEPTTIAGGLLGVLGLCWHQRRRLRLLLPRSRRA